MRRDTSLLAAAALTAVLLAPAAGRAQAAEKAKVTITPYGFLLVQGFWNDGPFAAKDYPGQALQNRDGGSFLISARGSRFGVKVGLPDDPFTGAKLSGVLELDFKGGAPQQGTSTTACTQAASGGAITCTTTTVASSTAWYNSLARLRLAYASASWAAGPTGKVSLIVGQDVRVIAPLAPTSIAFGYDQLFTQAGNLNTRDPQFKAVYDHGGAEKLGLNVTVAMLGPQDTFTGAPTGGIDYGAGNRSRKPNVEARVAASWKEGGKKLGELGLSGGVGWRRYNLTTAGADRNVTEDTTTRLVSVDAVANLPYVTVQGEGYLSDGFEDSHGGLVGSAVLVNAVNGLPDLTNLQSRGFWAQAVFKPIAVLSIPVGYGMAEVRPPASPPAPSPGRPAPATRSSPRGCSSTCRTPGSSASRWSTPSPSTAARPAGPPRRRASRPTRTSSPPSSTSQAGRAPLWGCADGRPRGDVPGYPPDRPRVASGRRWARREPP